MIWRITYLSIGEHAVLFEQLHVLGHGESANRIRLGGDHKQTALFRLGQPVLPVAVAVKHHLIG